MKRTFGLSVLTNKQAARIMPAAAQQSRLNTIRHVMEEKHVDSTVAANVELWHKQRSRRMAGGQQ